MQIVTEFIKKSLDKKIDGIGLSVFRIAYFSIFLIEIIQIFYYRHLIFDKIPYLEKAEINFGTPLFIWILVIIGIIIGYRTRFLLIINYLFTIIFLSSLHDFLYHVFFIYSLINFLSLFIPINNRLSIDSVLNEIKDNNPNQNLVSQFYYFIIPFLALGLVYIDSFFLKLTAESWVKGLGFWKPASLPMFINQNLSFILNFEYLMYFIGFFILAFEFLFIFLVLRKKNRVLFISIGVLFHLGIIIAFPIPLFGLTFVTIYLLLIPVGFLQKCYSFFKFEILKKIIKNFTIKNFNLLNFEMNFKDFSCNFWHRLIKFYVFFQLLLLFCTLTNIIHKKVNNEQTFINKLAKKTYITLQPFTASLFGISTTGLFIDHYHYDDYEHIIALTFVDKNSQKEIWLPIVNQNGQSELYGILWRNFTSKVNNKKINQFDLENGIKRYTAYWAFKNNVKLKNVQFNIKVKKIKQPKYWEKDFLKNQINQPWIDGGNVLWKDNKIFYNTKEIEKL